MACFSLEGCSSYQIMTQEQIIANLKAEIAALQEHLPTIPKHRASVKRSKEGLIIPMGKSGKPMRHLATFPDAEAIRQRYDKVRIVRLQENLDVLMVQVNEIKAQIAEIELGLQPKTTEE